MPEGRAPGTRPEDVQLTGPPGHGIGRGPEGSHAQVLGRVPAPAPVVGVPEVAIGALPEDVDLPRPPGDHGGVGGHHPRPAQAGGAIPLAADLPHVPEATVGALPEDVVEVGSPRDGLGSTAQRAATEPDGDTRTGCRRCGAGSVGDAEVLGDGVPEVAASGVVAECPDADAAQPVAVDQRVLVAERLGVVVVELAIGAVVGPACVTWRRAVPRRPGRLRWGVPVPHQAVRRSRFRCAGEVGQDVVVGDRADAVVAAPRRVEALARGRVGVPVVGDAEDHLVARHLGEIGLDHLAVRIRRVVHGVQGVIGQRLPVVDVVVHDVEGVDVGAETADVHHRPALGGGGVGVDGEVGLSRHQGAQRVLQLADEGGEVARHHRRDEPLEVDVDTVAAPALELLDDVGDRRLPVALAPHQGLDRRVVHGDGEHHAVAGGVGGVDQAAHLRAPPPLIAGVLDDGAVGVEVEAVVGDGGQVREPEVRLPVPARDLTRLGEAEDLRVAGSGRRGGAVGGVGGSGAARRNVDGRPRTEVDLGVEELAGLGAGGDPRLEREVALIEDLGGTGLSGQDLDRTGVGGEPGGRGVRGVSHGDRRRGRSQGGQAG